jgi:hypothetical protein
VREVDADQIAVAIICALVRAGRGVCKTHKKVTIGKPMSFAVLRNPSVTVS